MHGMHSEKYWGVLYLVAGHSSLKKCQVGKWIRKFKKKENQNDKKKKKKRFIHLPESLLVVGSLREYRRSGKLCLAGSKQAGCVSPALCN